MNLAALPDANADVTMAIEMVLVVGGDGGGGAAAEDDDAEPRGAQPHPQVDEHITRTLLHSFSNSHDWQPPPQLLCPLASCFWSFAYLLPLAYALPCT